MEISQRKIELAGTRHDIKHDDVEQFIVLQAQFTDKSKISRKHFYEIRKIVSQDSALNGMEVKIMSRFRTNA